ncbi:HPr family phosphocarrier protein [Robiginitomaculum antarcticum]|uniref:HPr family phosphocarrier protein n=1 Tax=Robiginitomaculum antarcticum TaxID=437507 RepID=UPI00036442F8|nr:HPr family phosphocarrier protein [Robiginitomaculum antarcticum]
MFTPYTARVTLVNKRGLHARASAKFVATANQFDAVVKVTSHNNCGAETVIADSIMELLMLGCAVGEDLTISAAGVEGKPALTALTKLVQNGFDEMD